MTKRIKFITCLVVYVTMLTVAITVGFFICKNNLEKQFAPPKAQEGEVMIQYKTEGDAPTETTITFETGAKTLKVEFLVSSMYQGEYTVPYTVENNQLSIETATQIEANDISGISAMIGLPTTLTDDVVHTVAVDNGKLQLKIIFGADAVLFNMVIEGENLADLGIDATKLEAVAVTGVTLDATELTLKAGASAKLFPTIQPEGAIAGTYVWTSSDEAVATVAKDGTVTAVAEGTATIAVTAADGAASATCVVTVNAKEEIAEPVNVLTFVGEGDAPTTTTVTFDVENGKVKVEALASAMYQLNYETTYSVENGTLVIANVLDLTAVDISGFAALLGLPTELPGTAIHTIADGTLTILFGDPEKLEEAANLGTLSLTAELLALLGI